jgi:maltose alpha-D-glucosyltransferase/alpha-amylase
VVYGDRFILKLFRRPDVGVNPDLEIGRFLTERAPGVHTPATAGYIEYQPRRGQGATLAILQQFVPNEGDAWSYTIDSLGAYFERVLSQSDLPLLGAPVPDDQTMDLVSVEVPPLAADLLGGYLQSAELLGRRTGELHVALSSAPEDPSFSPEPFTPFYQRSLYQSMRGLVANVFPLLQKRLWSIPEATRAEAEAVLGAQDRILQRLHSVTDQRLTGMRIRVHGDYHLGQVLYTGKDFVIIDFEGEPARPLSERGLKRSPLRDVAGMLRSFHYAAYSALFQQAAMGVVRPEQMEQTERWARFWYAWAALAYLRGYLAEANAVPILPQTPEELQTLLDAHLLEKAIYELGYELNNRPDWVAIPLAGIRQLIETGA